VVGVQLKYLLHRRWISIQVSTTSREISIPKFHYFKPFDGGAGWCLTVRVRVDDARLVNASG
jgi:hypothetical protein